MTSNRNTVIRSMHDLGAAAWFGGTLMGAVGVNGVSKDVKDPAEPAAIGTTVYSAVLGAKIAAEGSSAPVEGGTVPSSGTPDKVAKLQRQQRVLQWATPALTGGIIILGAQQGEQQRASEQIRTRGWSAVLEAVNRVPKLIAS